MSFQIPAMLRGEKHTNFHKELVLLFRVRPGYAGFQGCPCANGGFVVVVYLFIFTFPLQRSGGIGLFFILFIINVHTHVCVLECACVCVVCMCVSVLCTCCVVCMCVVCVYVCEYCHTDVKDRGQLLGVSTLLPPWDQAQVVRLPQ